MILRYYDEKVSFEEDDDERIKSYEIFCPHCNGNNLIEIDDEYEFIDGHDVVTLSIECQDCKKVFYESGINLELSEY